MDPVRRTSNTTWKGVVILGRRDEQHKEEAGIKLVKT
jgi:hypothetical protein